MTHFSKNNNSLRNLGMARLGLAVLAMVAMLILSSATTAFGGGGIGTGGGDGDGDASKTDGNRYTRTWDDFSRKDKRWAHRTSECESGGDPHIHSPGGEYHGAFQFSPSTWKSSPMSPGGDAHTKSWKTQAVVAVKLKHRDGAGHWPVCG